MDAESAGFISKEWFRAEANSEYNQTNDSFGFFENNLEWDREVVITKDDKESGGKVVVSPGEKLKLRDLFNVALVASVNSAAYELARGLI